MVRRGTELLKVSDCFRLPGVSHYDMRRHLCSPHPGNFHRRQNIRCHLGLHGIHGPPVLYSLYLFKAYITNTAAYDSGERDNAGAWLYFPANAEEIAAAFTEIGLPASATPDMYFFDDYVSDVPGLRLALPMYAHVDDLAMLAQELSDLPAMSLKSCWLSRKHPCG